MVADPTCDSATLIARAVATSDFRLAGAVFRRSGHWWWAVVNPDAHPWYVWRQPAPGAPTYASAARSLHASVFTNGPMMGKLIGRAKITRRLIILEFVWWPVLTSLAAAFVAGKRRSVGAAGGAGVLLGLLIAWWRTFVDWVPCGVVHGQARCIHDERNFDAEGPRHAWFGRSGRGFASYQVGDGDLPPDLVEGAGGLIRLVRDFAPAGSRAEHAARDRDFLELKQKRGVVAWGLAPIETGQGSGGGVPAGVLVVLGSKDATAAAAADQLCQAGVRDAVATDQRGMVMLGSRGRFMIGPPTALRQAIQVYGFCCQ